MQNVHSLKISHCIRNLEGENILTNFKPDTMDVSEAMLIALCFEQDKSIDVITFRSAVQLTAHKLHASHKGLNCCP